MVQRNRGEGMDVVCWELVRRGGGGAHEGPERKSNHGSFDAGKSPTLLQLDDDFELDSPSVIIRLVARSEV